MGNCSGIFANCNGEDQASNSVRRIDAADMKRALTANEVAMSKEGHL